jgi:hypothetical protein
MLGREVRSMYGCCGGRSFLTKEEKLELLEEYKKGLEAEAQGVEERIKELRKQN